MGNPEADTTGEQIVDDRYSRVVLVKPTTPNISSSVDELIFPLL